MRTRYWSEIQAAAKKHDLDPMLVEAIVVQESAGNADAFRFEPNFWNRYLKPMKIYVGANPREVSSSYGLMQVMYQVAVERGFPRDLRPQHLFIVENALEYGCRQLKFQFDAAKKFSAEHPEIPVQPKDIIMAAIASYNGGNGGNRPGQVLRNAAYARSVLTNYATLLTEHAR